MKYLYAFVLALLLAACAATPPSGEWPATIVSYDKMEKLSRFDLQLYTQIGKDMPLGRNTWLLWVDEAGAVRNVRMLESSGHPNFDDAVMRGIWQLRFKPWLVDGKPQAVTVAMPVQMR